MAKAIRELKQYPIKYLFSTKESSNGEIEAKKKEKKGLMCRIANEA